MLFSVAVPRDNQRGPQHMQQVLAAVHQYNRTRRRPFQLSYAAVAGKVTLLCQCCDELGKALADAIRDAYPQCSVTALDATVPPVGGTGGVQWSTVLHLSPDLFPMLRHPQYEDVLNRNFADPVARILGAVKPDGALSARIEIHVRPAGKWRCWWANRAVDRLARTRFRANHVIARLFAHLFTSRFLVVRLLAMLLGMFAGQSADRPSAQHIDTSASRLHDREDDVQAAADKMGKHLFETQIRLVVSGPRGHDQQARETMQTMIGALGALTVSRLATFHVAPVRRSLHRLRRRGFLLSDEELATLWHPPTQSVVAERMHASDFSELEAPLELPDAEKEDGVVLGRVQYRNDRRLVALACEDRMRHLYIVGKTGMGKTTLLKTQICADIAAGRGVCVIDPHGDLADDTLRSIPRARTNDVIILDPSDTEFALPFNPLACPIPDRQDLVVDDVLSAFDRIYDFSRTQRLSDTLRNALFVCVEQGRTLLDLLRFFGDAAFHERLIADIGDDVVRTFWHAEFPTWNKQDRNLTVAAIRNKIRPFLMNRSIRAIVGQSGRSLDIRRTMDEGTILIVNLSKGKIGERNAHLLGALIVTSIQQAAMSRANVPESQRREFYLYVDEFQNFVTSSFSSILSEARKYRLGLTVAHQYLTQIDRDIANAVFGNVGSMVAFQVGIDDADTLATQLSKHQGQVQPHHLANVPKYHAYVRLLLDGSPSPPFTMRTLQPQFVDEDRTAAVVNASRRHARSTAIVSPRSAVKISNAGS